MVNSAALRRTNKSNTGKNCKTAPDNSTSLIIDNLLRQYSTLCWFIERFSDNSAFLTLTGLTLIFASSQFALFPLLNINSKPIPAASISLLHRANPRQLKKKMVKCPARRQFSLSNAPPLPGPFAHNVFPNTYYKTIV